jgi:hypothetical protein
MPQGGLVTCAGWEMSTPKFCPVCSHDSIKPVTKATFAKLENEQEPEVVAYGCGRGHFFLVRPPEVKKQAERK